MARILWWIADPVNGTTDRVNRGHVQVYKDLLAARVGGSLQTLSQVNNYYLNTVATSDKQRTDFGAIFQANSVSPVPTAPIGQMLLPTDAPPMFTWQRGNNGANDTFRLIIWDDAGLTHRVIDHFLVPGNVTSYTLSAAQWALVDGTQGTKWFGITGSDLLQPDGVTAYAGIEATGPYWSDAYSFAVVPEPGSVGLVIVVVVGLLARRRGHETMTR